MALAIRLLRNTLASYLGTIVTTVVGLFLTPFIIRSLGSTPYGLWALVGSLVAYFTLLDSSLANALTKYAAEYVAREDQMTVNRLTSTLFFAFCVAGGLGLGVAALLSAWLPTFFTLPAEYADQARRLFMLLGLTWALGLPLSIFGALLSGYQRFDILNSVGALSLIVNAGLTVLVLRMGGGLLGLGLVALLTTLLRSGLYWALLKTRVERRLKVNLQLFDRSSLRLLLSYSAFMIVMFACLQIESSTGNVIIGRYLSLAEITPFAIGQKLSGFMKNLLLPLTFAFFPAFSALSVTTDEAHLSAVLLQGIRITVALGTPLIGCLALLAGPLIAIWVSPQFAGGAPVAVALGLQAFLYVQLVMAATLLQGLGRLQLLAGMHLFNVLFNVGFSLLLVERLGITAVALASLIPWAITYFVVLSYTCWLGGVSFWKLVQKALLPPLLAWLPAGIFLKVASILWPVGDLFRLILLGSIATFLYLAIYFGLAITTEERAACFAFARRAWRQKLGHAGAAEGASE